MQFVYTGPGSVEIPALGITVAKGEEFEASGDIAKGLAGQEQFERTDKPGTTDKKES